MEILIFSLRRKDIPKVKRSSNFNQYDAFQFKRNVPPTSNNLGVAHG